MFSVMLSGRQPGVCDTIRTDFSTSMFVNALLDVVLRILQ